MGLHRRQRHRRSGHQERVRAASRVGARVRASPTLGACSRRRRGRAAPWLDRRPVPHGRRDHRDDLPARGRGYRHNRQGHGKRPRPLRSATRTRRAFSSTDRKLSPTWSRSSCGSNPSIRPFLGTSRATPSSVAGSCGPATTSHSFSEPPTATPQFEHADEIDVARTRNRNLAFGAGAHRCLGSSLARLEVRVALEESLLRLPDLRIAPGESVVYCAAPPRSTPAPGDLQAGNASVLTTDTGHVRRVPAELPSHRATL